MQNFLTCVNLTINLKISVEAEDEIERKFIQGN